MKKQWITTAGIFLFAMAFLTGMNAQPRQRGGVGNGPDPGHRYGQGFGQYGQGQGIMAHHFALDLSDEQKEEVKTLRVEHYKTMKPLKNTMIELKARERTLMSEEKVDLKKVNSVIDEQTELMNRMRKLQAEQKVKMKSVFTDEQLMKLEQHRKIRKHKRAGGNEFRGTPRRGLTS